MECTDSVVLLAALSFAAEKHTVQRRKDIQRSPYINHPVAVANVLAQCGVTDIITLQAAVLHDTIEDTETTAEELREKFGDEVTNIVLEVTDDKTLDKKVRKQKQIDHAPFLSPRAKLVKLADKLINVHDVAHTPPDHWPLERRKEYLDWADAVVAGLRGSNSELELRYDSQVFQGRSILENPV